MLIKLKQESKSNSEKEERIAFATITREGKLIEKSQEIDKKLIEKVANMLKIISTVSEKSSYDCGRLQFIKIDGYKEGYNYRILVYSISESLYSVIFTRTVFKETFIPDIDELTTMGKVLYETMGDESKNILFKLGEKLGISCTQIFNNLGMYGEESIKGASTTLSAMQILNSGWNIEKDKITVTVYDLEKEDTKSGGALYYYIKGLITGIAKTAFKKVGSAEEIDRAAMGSNKCKFIFRREINNN